MYLDAISLPVPLLGVERRPCGYSYKHVAPQIQRSIEKVVNVIDHGMFCLLCDFFSLAVTVTALPWYLALAKDYQRKQWCLTTKTLESSPYKGWLSLLQPTLNWIFHTYYYRAGAGNTEGSKIIAYGSTLNDKPGNHTSFFSQIAAVNKSIFTANFILQKH